MFGDPILNDKNWETKKIADIAPVRNYNGVIENKVWLLNLDMVESQSGEIIDYLYVEKSTLGSSICSFDESNVLYSKLRPYLNKVVLPKYKGVATSELLPLRPKKELDRFFLAHLLRSDSFVEYISNKVAGSKMPRVSMVDFRNFDCILPPIEFQISYKKYIQQLDKYKFLQSPWEGALCLAAFFCRQKARLESALIRLRGGSQRAVCGRQSSAAGLWKMRTLRIFLNLNFLIIMQ